MRISIMLAISVVFVATWLPQLVADTGEVIHIVSHKQTKVVTDPSKGSNPYPKWTEFPPATTDYRKVILYITYQCPDGQHCGEWDYIDGVYLRRLGGQANSPHNIEIARMISPYGSRFDSTWAFTWHMDITDYSILLHDSVEVEFLHTGYESNTDRGWLITVDFEITEGPPPMQCLGFDSLWSGSIPFGDSSRPIEEILSPRTFTCPDSAAIARFRIVQTGHGMDDFENCAEFCNKYRNVLLDDVLISERQLWRECGINPLYPQAGTWIFDRANWCPGEIVQPDIYDLMVTGGTDHKIDIDMEPYINSSKPTANYFVQSHLIYFGEPWASNDASVAEILIPSAFDEYSRPNPACANPLIMIKNNGREVLHSLTIGYGHEMPPQYTFEWNGELNSQEIIEVELPGIIAPLNETTFLVMVDSPNGVEDEYPQDNIARSVVPATPIYDTTLILTVRTNADSSQTDYWITDAEGEIVFERPSSTTTVSTTYRDTLTLSPGCYELVVADTAGDGLDFWFNPEGGYGYARLLDKFGRLLKAFPSDFGSEARHSFIVRAGANPPVPEDDLPIVNPFPARNEGLFDIDIFLNKRCDLRIRIVDESGVETVLDNLYTDVKETMLPIDISTASDGVYYVKVTVNDETVTRRIRVKRGE
ncbi:MAG: peptide-N-glycosidase F-related protein [Candidatus Zixiibacteriota bacterium]